MYTQCLSIHCPYNFYGKDTSLNVMNYSRILIHIGIIRIILCSCSSTDMTQGRRNGFVIGGGAQKNLRIFLLHFHIERIRFCTLVYL